VEELHEVGRLVEAELAGGAGPSPSGRLLSTCRRDLGHWSCRAVAATVDLSTREVGRSSALVRVAATGIAIIANLGKLVTGADGGDA